MISIIHPDSLLGYVGLVLDVLWLGREAGFHRHSISGHLDKTRSRPSRHSGALLAAKTICSSAQRWLISADSYRQLACADDETKYRDVISLAGTGLLKRYPCSFSQPESRTAVACSSVSIPSAVTGSDRAFARATVA